MLITAIGVFLGPRLAEKSRRHYNQRQVHLQEIKDEVLRPLLNVLNEYYIPISERRKANIEDSWRYEEVEEVPITGNRRRSVEELVVVEPQRSESQQLYRCTKQSHFPGLVESWENFTTRFAEYNAKCLGWVKGLRDRITQQVNIPVLSPPFNQPKWIAPNRLAVWIFNRQLGVEFQPIKPIKADTDTWGIEFVSSRFLEHATEKEKDLTVEVLDKLEKDRAGVEDLIKEAEELKGQAYHLKVSLEDSLKALKLNGKCTKLKI